MLAGLVYDNIRALHRLVEEEDDLPQRRKVFLSHIAVLEELFKLSNASHVCYGNETFQDLNK